MLAQVLDAVLGTTTKVRILRTLLPLSSPVSGTEARRLAGVRSVKAMWASLEELTELGILLRGQTRGTHLYQINREHHLAEPLAALFAAEARRAGEVRGALRSALESAGLSDAVRSAVLYGSNARGDAGPRSDLDVLVVTREEGDVGRVRDALVEAGRAFEARFGPPLSAYVLSESRVRERYRDGDPLILSIASEGRELFGTSLGEMAEAW